MRALVTEAVSPMARDALSVAGSEYWFVLSARCVRETDLDMTSESGEVETDTP